MAFKTWQIGLHIQQHEALAIAVIHGASGWSLQRWWRLPLMNASTAEGTIPDPQSLAHVLRPRSRELPLRHHVISLFPQIGHCNALFHIRRCVCGNVSKSHGFHKRWRVSWIWIGLIAFRLSGRCAKPCVQRYRRAKQRNFRAVNAGANAQCAHRCCNARCLRVTALAAVYTFGAAMSGLAR